MELVKHRLYAPVLVALLSVLSCGCSINQLTAKASMPLIEGGVIALNREQDLQLAKESIPANMAVLEALIVNDPNNVELQVYAAQAYYGYAYGFIEDEDPKRASDFYLRGMKHGFKALSRMGLPEEVAYLALYLCSDEASFVTGCDYPIDGGFVKLNT